MCGIAGIISKQKISPSNAKKMIATLKHRGPDGEGISFYQSKSASVAIAQRRLAIIDLSPLGKQPMEDILHTCSIVFNGEIYNYMALKEELVKKGHTFKSQSDTEVIIEGYKEWGEKVVEKIEGLFALVLYDKKKETILFARDHFGKKPLYYFIDNDIFLFASEIKALLTYPQFKKKLHIDWDAVEKYLMYGYIPSPHSIYKEIRKLEASTYMIFDLKSWEFTKKEIYWHLENVKINKKITEKEVLEKVDSLLHKAVEKRMLAADVPVGTFLSGGIDSSLVTTIASKLSPGIETFSIAYGDSKFDESKYAKRVGKSLNIHQTMIHFKDSYAKRLLNEVLSYMDEPFADASILPTAFLSKYTKKKVTVSLSGDGGDEVFGGYPKYNAQIIAESIKKYGGRMFGKFIAPLLSYIPVDETWKEGMRKFVKTLDHHIYERHFILGSGSFTFDELEKVLKRRVNQDAIFEESKAYAKKWKQKDMGNMLLYLDAKIQLPDWYLAKVDRASMSQSLEVRSPFLDKNLTEFVFSLPSNMKFNNKENKIILKKLAQKYLPKDIIERKKMGFGLPLNDWMRGIFRKQIEDALTYLPEEHFDKTYVEILWREFVHDKKDHGTKIWRLFLLGEWLKKYE